MITDRVFDEKMLKTLIHIYNHLDDPTTHPPLCQENQENVYRFTNERRNIMNANQKVRAARKAFRIISEETYEGYEMDMAMDGSGDCGKMIYDLYQKGEAQRQSVVLSQLGITATEYAEALKEIISKESQHFKPVPWNCTPRAYNDICILIETL